MSRKLAEVRSSVTKRQVLAAEEERRQAEETDAAEAKKAGREAEAAEEADKRRAQEEEAEGAEQALEAVEVASKQAKKGQNTCSGQIWPFLHPKNCSRHPLLPPRPMARQKMRKAQRQVVPRSLCAASLTVGRLKADHYHSP